MDSALNMLQDSHTLLTIGIALVVVLLTGLATFFLTRKRKSDVLLLGICDSGKTSMLTCLLCGKSQQTFSSLKENVGSMEVRKKQTLHLVDIPGHERVRQQFWNQYREKARAVIFIVDSTTIEREIKDVAEYLYSILADRTVPKLGLKFLIVCNKQDEILAKGANVVRRMLEREMNTLRRTRAGALSGLDNAPAEIFIGSKKRDFSFDDISNSLDFVESSAIEGKLQPIRDWLARL